MNDILMDYVCEELEDIEREGLKASNLDSTDKLINIKKNLLKIQKYESEMEDGYSSNDGYWSAEGSYARDGRGRGGYSSARRGMHYVRGHYSRDDGYSSARRRDSMGRYSRAEAKESMMDRLTQVMEEATTDKERRVIEEAIAKIEKV